jgi:hypothetical protein
MFDAFTQRRSANYSFLSRTRFETIAVSGRSLNVRYFSIENVQIAGL